MADIDAVSAVHAAAYARARPAATMVAVAGLVDPRWKLEIEAEAVIASSLDRVEMTSGRRRWHGDAVSEVDESCGRDRLAVVGPGAIGATFAGVAARAGGRGDLVRTQSAGPDHRGAAGGGADDAGPGGARVDPSQVSEVDWVLLAVKTYQTPATRPWLAALCGPSTTVVVLQNGVEHRDRVQPLVGDATVLPAVVWCPAEARSRDVIALRGQPSLTVPDEPSGRRLAQLLTPGGARVDVVADHVTVL